MTPQEVVILVKEAHRAFAPVEIPVDVGKLRSYITDNLGIQFGLFGKVAWNGKLILGRLHRYEQGGKKWADIVVAETLNACWTRFVSTKELAHLIIDKEDDDCTHDPVGLIRGLVDFFPTNIAADIKSERVATLAATELLMPWDKKPLIMGMIAEGKNNFQIALHFKVPEKVVEYWRSDVYQNLMSDAWAGIDIDHEPIQT